jgi:hypothetical protein
MTAAVLAIDLQIRYFSGIEDVTDQIDMQGHPIRMQLPPSYDICEMRSILLSSTEHNIRVGYTDSNLAGYPDDRKSTRASLGTLARGSGRGVLASSP